MIQKRINDTKDEYNLHRMFIPREEKTTEKKEEKILCFFITIMIINLNNQDLL